MMLIFVACVFVSYELFKQQKEHMLRIYFHENTYDLLNLVKQTRN